MITLRIQNLTYKMGERTILDHVSVDVPQGSCVMITGHNGSGKSTLLKLIHAGNPSIIKRGTSVMMHQNMNDNLFGSLTIAENFYLVGARDTGWLNRMLDRFRSRPTLNTCVGDLSGGERQRLALYMRLHMKPQFLLLDEFTSALDPKSSTELMEEVVDISRKENMTIFIVTHDLDVLHDHSGYIHWEMEHGRLLLN